jgi:hypothetical protein
MPLSLLNNQHTNPVAALTHTFTRNLSKGEIADAMFPNETFDCALPQSWLHAMRARGFDAAPHFVMLYPKDGNEYCAPITPEGIRMAAIVATYTA